MSKVCDCFPELREVTEARERRYRAHPEKEAPEGPQSFVEVKVTSIGQLNELVECKLAGPVAAACGAPAFRPPSFERPLVSTERTNSKFILT